MTGDIMSSDEMTVSRKEITATKVENPKRVKKVRVTTVTTPTKMLTHKESQSVITKTVSPNKTKKLIPTTSSRVCIHTLVLKHTYNVVCMHIASCLACDS